jgi:hypothetical protein
MKVNLTPYSYTLTSDRSELISTGVSHIPQFEDASTSAAGGMRISKGDDTSPVGNHPIS